MQHLFLNKELSLLAREKGFDEPCFACYNPRVKHGEFVFELATRPLQYNPIEAIYQGQMADKVFDDIITAPLRQQILDWFRDKHYIRIEPVSEVYEHGIVATEYRILQLIFPAHIKVKYEGKEAEYSYRDYKVTDLHTAILEAFKFLP